jgi:predicted small integral membrane protein
MGKMLICLKYKIFSKYINHCEIRLHKKFHIFDFIYYNNIIFHSSNYARILHILLMNTIHTTTKKTDSIELTSIVGSFKICCFLLHTNPFQIVVYRAVLCTVKGLEIKGKRTMIKVGGICSKAPLL